MLMGDVIKSYLANIERELKTERATEHTHRPALKDLLEGLDSQIKATNEPKRVECGAPDFILRRDGFSVGYVETKDLGKSLDEAEDSDQLKRYKKSLPNLILTDYLEFRWFVDGQIRDSARLGRIGTGNKLLLDKKGVEETTELLKLFLESKPQPITTPRELSERTAKLAHIIRDIIVEAFEKDKASPDLKDLREAFAEVLIPDLNKPENTAEFADMYAQTIVYGLFAARCNHKGPGPFQRLGAAREIPKTNPFLKKLFETITGSSLEEEPYVDFVDDLVQVLANTNIEKVLENFGKRTKQEDPIVHFYETFLAAYDPETRERRGVYYTPEPVVQYIVKSVDHILETRFGLGGGLSDSSKVEYDREEFFMDQDGNPDRTRLLKVVHETSPKVLVLDPACGTGTFLYAVMDHIRSEFMDRGDAGLWSAYVRDHLLPRFFGFELLMAPYAVAHFKLGMLLAGFDLPKEKQAIWQYDFSSDERLGIYLTNTLEEAPTEWQKLFGAYRILSEEANAASRVKRDIPIMVILGNPPYSNFGMLNKGETILNLLMDYKKGLDEKKLNLDDDFIKFIRWAQWRIEHTGYGVLAFITNNAYIDGVTHRQMRKSLINAFDEIYILDLHGNSKRKEKCPDGSVDKNVFDIQVGVSIGIFVKRKNQSGPAKVDWAELWGTREDKYAYLSENDITSTEWAKLEPDNPYYFFVKKDFSVKAEYSNAWQINDIFPVNQNGLKTDRDDLFFDPDREVLEDRIRTFYSEAGMNASFVEKYQIKDSSSYKLLSRKAKTNFDSKNIHECLYRPFDRQWLYYATGFTSRPAWDIMRHMIAGENVFLISGRASQVIGSEEWDLISCTKNLVDTNLFRRGGNIVSPLFLYKNDITKNIRQSQLLGTVPWSPSSNGRVPNLSPEFVADLESRLDLKFVSDGHGDLAATFGPEDVFNYIYAVFHSPTYRKRYAEFLKIDFPRVPLTSNSDLFRKLCALGEELVALHLLESPQVTRLITRYPVAGDNFVEKGFPKFVAYEEGKPGYVYINKIQYFEGVPKEVWDFHVGGYQVCEKWLKDRRGRQLSFDDLMHYQKVIVALQETMRLMAEVDRAIPGWPME
jgi:predicted helicase